MTPAELLLSLVLSGVQSHYEHPSILDDKRLEHLLLAGKQILYKSHQESDVRQALGFSPKVWSGLTAVFGAAIPVLQSKSFTRAQRGDGFHGQNGASPDDAESNGVNGEVSKNSSSDLIAANYLSLVKDIERLNDLCTIARNLLATTKRAQNLAAERGFDQQVLKLIDVCVKVTARGFDGEGGNVRSEERWGKVVNLYKRLLITCLQFLHNFIMHNEQRKLILWLDLFGNANGAAQQQQLQQLQGKDIGVEVTVERDVAEVSENDRVQEIARLEPNDEAAAVKERVNSALEQLKDVAKGNVQLSDMATELSYNLDDVHALFEMMSTSGETDENSRKTAKLLMEKIRADVDRLTGLDSAQLDGNPDALMKVGAALRAQMPNKELPASVEQAIKNAALHLQRGGQQVNGMPDISNFQSMQKNQNDQILDQDLQMPRTAQSAAETLQEAKDELMARLQEPPSHLDDDEDLYDDDATASHIAEDGLESAEDVSEEDIDEDEEEDDDSSYHPSNDQERGLLTDVPLVLGPTEIEALPMIIQAGIVDNFGNTKNMPQHTAQERQNIRNMQSVRCHILLAQEAGRNVLRELLIFIAAWDLPDDEFYFKMMVQIMEAILKNGLMSHAYADFGQAKDIISPAQAVVVKILTHIYRGRYSPASAQAEKNKNNAEATDTALRTLKPPAPLTRVDVLTVRYIFTVFRGNIVPETCALIYLQGQIRQGLALAEDFPLNLWDMERVYEGVYQFLEFFAVLTENNDWNRLLVDWEIVYDLVTLIKELEAAIPKVNPLTAPKGRDGERDVGAVYTGEAAEMAPPPPPPPASSSMPPPPAVPSAVAKRAANGINASAAGIVERPYSLSPSPPPLISNSPSDIPSDNSTPQTIPARTTTGANNAVPQSSQAPTAATHDLVAQPGPQSPPPEDPSTFEWRNLKKLIILVLSSLVWKSRHVQDQIRETGGVDVVLNCTVHDANNPYIREHAVMCLKFLLEGNTENQKLVAELERRGVVAGYDELRGGFAGREGGFAARGVVGTAEGMGTGKMKRRAQSEGAGAGVGGAAAWGSMATGANAIAAAKGGGGGGGGAKSGRAEREKAVEALMDESVFEGLD